MLRGIITTIGILVCLLLFFIAGCVDSAREKLYVFHAGSLAQPLAEIEKLFEEKYPDIDVLREVSGSYEAVKKISELGRYCDVIISADYSLIEQLLVPNFCDWQIKFATNSMVLAYTKTSKYADLINANNWFEILQKDDVEWGHSNPNADPCGYRALLVMKLAEIHYKIPGLYDKLVSKRRIKNIREKETELVPLLKSGELDYTFLYRSMALQYGFKFVDLPYEIDLSRAEYADRYAMAELKLKDGTVQKGIPIVYGVSVPNNAPNKRMALEFVRFLLIEGATVFERFGQPFLKKPIVYGQGKLPDEMKSLPFYKEEREK